MKELQLEYIHKYLNMFEVEEKYKNIIIRTCNRTKKYHKNPSNRRKTLKKYL